MCNLANGSAGGCGLNLLVSAMQLSAEKVPPLGTSFPCRDSPGFQGDQIVLGTLRGLKIR